MGIGITSSKTAAWKRPSLQISISKYQICEGHEATADTPFKSSIENAILVGLVSQ
jgi:hypothetical protein